MSETKVNGEFFSSGRGVKSDFEGDSVKRWGWKLHTDGYLGGNKSNERMGS